MTRHKFNVYRITDNEIQRIYDVFTAFEAAVIDIIRQAYPNQPSELEQHFYEMADEVSKHNQNPADLDTLLKLF